LYFRDAAYLRANVSFSRAYINIYYDFTPPTPPKRWETLYLSGFALGGVDGGVDGGVGGGGDGGDEDALTPQ
jgi:hypothetical protein